MKRWMVLITLFLLLSALPVAAENTEDGRIPAFPGAEGGGMYTTGGRGGEVYVVTTLADSGPGSLRDAVSGSNRTIIFNVGGTIHLQSPLKITGSNLTIAGQTAPGDGITIADYPTTIEGDNIILRYLRFRLGDTYPSEADAFGGRYLKNIIIDHCSFSWSVDEVMSVYGVENLTIQWSIIAEAMHMSLHVKGKHGYGGIWGGKNASFHHNLFAHNSSRNPAFDSTAGNSHDFRNNVVYNWGHFSTYGGKGAVNNLINNYYKPGPETVNIRFTNAETDGSYYIAGNVMEGYPHLTANNWDGVHRYEGYRKLDEPVSFAHNPITTQSAEEAYEAVLAGAGAVLPRRDAVDARIVHEVRHGFGFHLNSQREVGGVPEFEFAVADRIDTDGDGIPDDWEWAHGLDPLDGDDANYIAPSGYTYLEEYLHSLVAASDPATSHRNPEVMLTAPANHHVMPAGSSVFLSATATANSGGVITRVVFYANGIPIGEVNAAPFAMEWHNVPDGTHYVTALAYDTLGFATYASPLVIHANTPGSIAPWSSADIGAVGIPGHTQLGANPGEVIVKSSGDIGGAADAFHYAYQQASGNVEIVAKIEHITPTTDEAEAGLMIRQGLEEDAPFVALMVPYIRTGLKGVTLSRATAGSSAAKIEPNEEFQLPQWVRLVRMDNEFTSLVSADGSQWQVVGTVHVDLPDEVYVGLAADASKTNSQVERYNTAQFSHVLIRLLPADFPIPPQSLQAVPGNKQVTLSWEPMEGASGYQVKVSRQPGGPYTVIARDWPDTTFTHTDLKVGLTYYYVVSTVNHHGESFDSVEVSATPTGELETIYYLNHDYEDLDIGTTPAEYTVTPDPQDVDHTVTVEAVPSDSVGNSSTKALKVYDNAPGNTYFEVTFPKQLGTVVLEFDYMSPSHPGTSALVHMKDSGKTRTPIMLELRKPQLPVAEDTYTLVYKNKANQDVKLTDPLDNHRWYHIKIVANVAANRMDIYLDHELVAEQVELKDDMRSLGLGYAMIGRTPGTGKGTMHFDNLKIYVEPIESPKGLKAIPGSGKVQLNWEVATGALTYQVKRSTTSGGPYELIATGVQETAYIDDTVTNGITYYYVVTAVGEHGESGPSNEVVVIPVELPDLPPAPTGLAGMGRDTQAEIHWDEVEGATHYAIYRSLDGRQYDLVQDRYLHTAYRDGGLVNGQVYYYAVTASNIGGESEKSAPVAVTPTQSLPTPTVSLTPLDQAIMLEWQGEDSAVYTIQRAEALAGPYEVIAEDVSALIYLDRNVRNGVPYYYIVIAKKGENESLPSQPVGARPKAMDGRPDAPSRLQARNQQGGVQLFWEAVHGAEHYQVYRRLAGEEEFVIIAEQVAALNYVDAGVSTGETYEYTVAAVNQLGAGYRSPIAKVTTTRVIMVAKDGSGDFRTVQAAIDSLPANNTEPVTILIQPGQYWEKIDIYRKHFITLIGLGVHPQDTVLIYDDNAKTVGEDGREIGTNASFSVRAEGHDITMENLTIANASGKEAGQAVALAARGDRQVYRNVRIIGWQDTLLAEGLGNRQYFVDSYIDGHVDFIFGSANAVFENSIIHSKAGGYITAASTQEGYAGYVFINSKLTADAGLAGTVDLGRPWRPYAHVVYIDTWMDEHIKPAGWHNWGNSANERTAIFAEYNSTGPGANPAARHAWTKQLTVGEAKQYAIEQLFSGTDGWDPRERLELPIEEEQPVVITIDDVIALVEHYQQTGDIHNAGIVNSLVKKLETGNLRAFVNEVRALRGKMISTAAADHLLEYAAILYLSA